MKPRGLRHFARLLSRRARVWGLCLAAPALALGCAHPGGWSARRAAAALESLDPRPASPYATAKPADGAAGEDAIRPVSHTADEKKPDAPAEKDKKDQDDCTAPPRAEQAKQVKARLMPVDLDTVLHLAEDQNVQVSLARARLEESQIQKDLADLSWLPEVNAGLAYYRHEGGIQRPNGERIHSSSGALFPGVDLTARLDLREHMYQQINAERKVWEQEGHLSRITSETLLDAANTYIDLLTARTSEAVLRRIQNYQAELLKWAEALFKEEKSAEVLVATIKAASAARQVALEDLRQAGDAASSKLAYLLGLSTDVQLVPADAVLKPVELVDALQPSEALVSRALAAGPGVRELEQMIAVIQDGLDRAAGPSKYLPAVEMRTIEGAFGAGKGSGLDFDNRWDLGLQLRWNLSGFLTARDRQKAAYSQLRQVNLSYDDLRGKLTLGVEEAQQAVQATRNQIRTGSEQIKHACRSYSLSDMRLRQRVEGSSTAEVLQAIRSMEGAHLSSLQAIRNHNKAQVRLMVLMGAAGHNAIGGHPGAAPGPDCPK